jgi:hypothetical protein
MYKRYTTAASQANTPYSPCQLSTVSRVMQSQAVAWDTAAVCVRSQIPALPTHHSGGMQHLVPRSWATLMLARFD